jgi:hypothetical protein
MLEHLHTKLKPCNRNSTISLITACIYQRDQTQQMIDTR